MKLHDKIIIYILAIPFMMIMLPLVIINWMIHNPPVTIDYLEKREK